MEEIILLWISLVIFLLRSLNSGLNAVPSMYPKLCEGGHVCSCRGFVPLELLRPHGGLACKRNGLHLVSGNTDVGGDEWPQGHSGIGTVIRICVLSSNLQTSDCTVCPEISIFYKMLSKSPFDLDSKNLLPFGCSTLKLRTFSWN